jgi:hypothetical protein
MLRSVGVFRTDVSGIRIGPIFKSCVKEEAWLLKMGPIRSPETSVRNEPMLRDIPEDDRIAVTCFGILHVIISKLITDIQNVTKYD